MPHGSDVFGENERKFSLTSGSNDRLSHEDEIKAVDNTVVVEVKDGIVSCFVITAGDVPVVEVLNIINVHDAVIVCVAEKLDLNVCTFAEICVKVVVEVVLSGCFAVDNRYAGHAGEAVVNVEYDFSKKNIFAAEFNMPLQISSVHAP